MRRIVLILPLLLLFTLGASAQNRSIEFEESKVLSEIYDKAIKEDKLVFIDCYTDWCGPCKNLAANVFTRDEVADFFNENFINAKFEMEKDKEGIANAKKWGIRAFPTMIFVDPNTEEIVHRLVGAGTPEWLIQGAKDAMDPTKNIASMTKRYEDGERDFEFLSNYIEVLEKGYMSESVSDVVNTYFNSLDKGEIATKKNWDFFNKHVQNPLSDIQRYIMANRQPFYDIVGEKDVDNYLTSNLLNYASSIIGNRRGLDKDKLQELKEYVATIDLSKAREAAEAYISSSELVESGKWSEVFNKISEIKESKDSPFAGFGADANNYIRTFIMKIANGNRENPEALDKYIDFINGKIEQLGDDYAEKMQYAAVKMSIFGTLLEDEEKQEEAYAEAMEYRGKWMAEREAKKEEEDK